MPDPRGSRLLQYDGVIDRLLNSDEPAVRYKALVNVLGCEPLSARANEARNAIRQSGRVKTMLSLRGPDGKIPRHAYSKFNGAHWILANLADLGYPSGDSSLGPLADQVLDTWLSPGHACEWVCSAPRVTYGRHGVPIFKGRARRCASQEGNALYSTLALGVADERADQLAANLIRWQWPDGGWNCDKRPQATNSSFHESLIPLRGLALHAKLWGSKESEAASKRAAEIFLKRGMYKCQSDGKVIHPNMVKIHYPCYWHYDFLFGLKVMAEVGFLDDPRCSDALDMLEAKRLPDGGFPAEAKYYRVSAEAKVGGASICDWGPTSSRQMNAFVTVDALYVLRAAGRLDT